MAPQALRFSNRSGLTLRVVVPWDPVALGLTRTARVPCKVPGNAVARARDLQRALEAHGSDAGVAEAYGLTRASVCQYLTLVRRLPADLLDQVEAVTDRDRLKRLSLRQLLAVAQVEGEGKRRSRLGFLLQPPAGQDPGRTSSARRSPVSTGK